MSKSCFIFQEICIRHQLLLRNTLRSLKLKSQRETAVNVGHHTQEKQHKDTLQNSNNLVS